MAVPKLEETVMEMIFIGMKRVSTFCCPPDDCEQKIQYRESKNNQRDGNREIKKKGLCDWVSE